MNPRIKKELRPLLLPWVTALTGVILALLLGQESEINTGQFVSFLAALGVYAFLGGAALVGSSAFGVELQHRTLSLLLTQPSDRARLWRQKMLVSGLVILSIALVGGAGLKVISLAHPWPPFASREMAFIAIFLLATACSCGFWTLEAGSTLGGVAFTVAFQFAVGLGAVFIASRIRGHDLEEGEILPVLAVTAVVYSAVLLWLGRRKFVHFELKSARFGEGISGSPVWFPDAPRILVSRAEGRTLNLVRKELRLQKPVLQLAAVFVLCWLATFLFQWLRPRQDIIYLFDVITGIYAPVACLLAGCVSLGEEKALGLFASQLTLPLSAVWQWVIKLAVGAGTAAVLCLGLPLLLFWVTGALIDVSGSGLINEHDNGFLALSCICGVIFLLGFWAISMFSNTVKAALVAVFGLIAVGGCVALGAWLDRNGVFELGPLVTLMCHLQLPPEDFVVVATRAARVLAYSWIGGIILLCLAQSLLQFRDLQATLPRLLTYALSLAVLISGLSFFSLDFIACNMRVYSSGPVQELQSALNAVTARHPTAEPEKTLTVTPQELGRLSPLTDIWLRNASITYRSLPPIPRNGFAQYIYQATVEFPNGHTFQVQGGYTNSPFPLGHGP